MAGSSSFWQRRRVRAFHEFRDELRRFLEHQGIPAALSRDLILATQEACNNACQHGAMETGGRRVAPRVGCDVAVTRLGGTIVIEVADRGPGFDLETVKADWPPTLLEDGGRGLFIIAELADRLEVVQRRPGTVVRIVRALE
jgi:anti-sigma regulatory factor (Ser/Thr protein kinase)